MTPEQIELVKGSFSILTERGDEAATMFYDLLFVMRPTLRLLFPDDMRDQKCEFVALLGFAIGSLDRSEIFLPALEDLGRRHALRGVRDEHYSTVEAALLLMLEEILGAANFDERTKAAWTQMNSLVSGAMRRAARELADETQPNRTENYKPAEIKKMKPTKTIATITTVLLSPALASLIFAVMLFIFSSGAYAATFTVTNTSDASGNVCAIGNCSLRQALSASYFDINGVINFNISGGGVKTISPLTPLPEVGHITIDGTSQPGYSGTPLIELNGANVGANPSYGLVTRSTTTIKGLIINRFGTGGIYVTTALDGLGDALPVNVTVKGNYIGTNAAGTAALANGNGIYVDAFLGTVTVGGTGANERNLISGNNLSGINISGCAINQATRITASIKGNYIGTDSTGTVAVGNLSSGVVEVCSDTTNIGGTTAAERNIISGNKGPAGIDIQSNGVTVQGNYVGSNAAGTGFIGNTNDGIRIAGDGIIGGVSGGAGNLISGNGGNGIKNVAAGYIVTVQGNKIGTNAAGTGALANSSNGIYVLNGSTDIGGITGNAGNLISGNSDNGIKIEGTSNITNNINGNRIGVTGDDLSGLANTNSGIYIASSGTVVGQAGISASQNIIAGNFGDGILLTGQDAHDNVVENNLIGTNLSGSVIKNFAIGVAIDGGAHDNRIGGSNSTAANTIVNSLSDGVYVTGSTTINNAILSNVISSNGGLGIDLETNGVNANDPGDGDPGGNSLQNYPVIQTAIPNRVIGTLNSQPNKSYTVQIYRNNTCNASGYGEGQFYLGSQTVMTDASGNAPIDASVAISTGQIVSATSTDATGNTSEFAQCVTTGAAPGALSFGSASYSVNENAGTATITVSRTFGSGGAISVHYGTSNGTGIAGTDYTTASGTLNWANGDTASKTFTVPITNDTIDEPNRTVNLTLSSPSNGAGLLTSTAVLTIIDDDPPPTISVNDVSKAEGNQGITNFAFNITLSSPSGMTVVVDYQSTNGTATAGIDYAFNGDTIVFNPGETTKSINIIVNGDTLSELDETFVVNLQDPQNATLQKGQGIGTILDDDNPGKIQFGLSGTVNEGAGTATILVSRTNGTAGTVSIDYATSNGTATAGADYTAVSGTLLFLDGQTNASFTVPIVQDNIGEANETVFLTLSNPSGGATLGTPAVRTLTIIDDDGGLPAKVTISGQVIENNSPLSNVLVTLAGSQSKTVLTDALGNYAFANLAGGGNYLVTPTANGRTFEPSNLSYTNLSANVTDATFVSSTGPVARIVRIANGDTVGGNAVVVPIELVSLGNENSIGFSVSFDGNLLSNAQVSLGSDTVSGSLVVNSQTGKIGAIVSLPTGQHFASGTRQIATITFMTVPTAVYSTPVAFGDSPVTREVTDQNAGVLPAEYADGVVTFSQGYEADVAPRPTGSGNGSVTVADYTMIGKFVAGTLSPDQLNEFQRADCSPRGTKGNGVLTVSDYTQAGRYAAALDTVQTAGGASAPNLVAKTIPRGSSMALAKLATQRTVRVVNTQASVNSQVLVSLELDSNGDENGFGFTLSYDPSKLSSPVVAAGTDAATASLIPNTNIVGKVGVVIAYPVGQTSQPGTKQLVTIRFNIPINAGLGSTPLTFGDTPVFREVVDANADVLPTTFTDGSVQIFGPTAAGVLVGGRISDKSGRGIGGAMVTIVGSAGPAKTSITNPFGFYRFSDVLAGETYIVSVKAKGRSFNPGSRVMTIFDETSSLDFVADN